MSHNMTVVTVVAALIMVACTDTAAQDTEPEGAPASLSYAFDGDSMEVDIDGRTEEVRLLGINAPEGDECFGGEARNTLIGMIADQNLVLVEGGGDDTDRYGRLLRYVYVDGENVNGRMLAEGRAVTLQGDHRYNDEFVEISNLAAEAMLGMWAHDACGPASPLGAKIVEFTYDPPGPDDERLIDEYVTIANSGTKPLNLAGWIVRDESSQNRYVFKGLSLKSGQSVTVRTACGEDRSDTVFWCSEQSIWSNDGDTAILQDRHGNVADRWTYLRSP
ncbi:MAG: lamin tail domain-containing protein [Acidimicrobiia bacterium]|nr:lamin tail domain-containing protein [Acidimicrobiia bacterium]